MRYATDSVDLLKNDSFDKRQLSKHDAEEWLKKADAELEVDDETIRQYIARVTKRPEVAPMEKDYTVGDEILLVMRNPATPSTAHTKGTIAADLGEQYAYWMLKLKS